MQPCPRKSEATLSSQLLHESHWRDDGTCSYCGSLNPDIFFEAIKSGSELGPTDKNYKVYVDRPNSKMGQPCVDSAANFSQNGPGWVEVTDENIEEFSKLESGFRLHAGQWIHIGTVGPIKHDKFYFQHLTREEQLQFLDLLNGRKINIGYPGHFYVLPFFISK